MAFDREQYLKDWERSQKVKATLDECAKLLNCTIWQITEKIDALIKETQELFIQYVVTREYAPVLAFALLNKCGPVKTAFDSELTTCTMLGHMPNLPYMRKAVTNYYLAFSQLLANHNE